MNKCREHVDQPHPKLCKECRNDYNRMWRRTISPLRRICRRKASRINGLNKKFGIKDRVTATDLIKLFQKQGGICVLTGRELIVSSDNKHPDAFSIDRKKTELGYRLKNLRFITNQANSARGCGTDHQLRKFCQDILEYR